jgi:hypothetical protein
MAFLVTVSLLIVRHSYIHTYTHTHTHTHTHKDHYSVSLAKCMKKMLLVTQAASLAKAIEKSLIGGDVKIPVTS